MRASVDVPSKRQKIRFVKITYDGASMYVRPEEVEAFIDGDERSLYATEDVWLSPAEYAALPEFMGW